MNTITIQLCEEDRSRIDSLIGSISLLTSVIGSALDKETQEKIIAENTEPDQTPVVEEPTPEPAAPEVKPVSLAEFQKAVTMAVAKGAEAKKAAKAIINKYAESVSGVPEDKRAEVMAELANI
jgi:hypothetical protein